MPWERRGIAVAVATPLCVVLLHALATLQAAWLAMELRSAAMLVPPIVAAGLACWLRPSWVLGALVALASGGLLVVLDLLPWAAVPLLMPVGALLGIVAARVGARLPESLDDAWKRSRAKTSAWALLALVMLLQISRLSTFMADQEQSWGSTFPPVEFTVTHMCMASYVHAADLSRRDEPNLYAPEHYPSFGISEPQDIASSVLGLQPWFDDPFLYPPPFLLLPRAWLGLSNDYLHMRSLWFAVQFLAFVLFAVLLARWLGGELGAWALWLLPLLLVSMPTMFNFQFGQAHLLTVWISLGAMLAFETRRTALGGAMLAWAIASKIFPGVLALYLLFQKRWRELAWTAAFALVLGALSLAVIGVSPFAQFVRYMLPRLESGEAFSYVTETLSITTNLSIPGSVWKLPLLGIEGGEGMLRTASVVYTVLLLIAIWLASRLELDRAGRVQVWLALLVLASLRSPIVPIYGAAPVLWLMSLQLGGLKGAPSLLFFALSWLFVSGLPPAPKPAITIALYGLSQLAILYWVLRPFWSRSPGVVRVQAGGG